VSDSPGSKYTMMRAVRDGESSRAELMVWSGPTKHESEHQLHRMEECIA